MSQLVSIALADSVGADRAASVQAVLSRLADMAAADGWAGHRLEFADWQEKPADGAGPLVIIQIEPAEAGTVTPDHVRAMLHERAAEKRAMAQEGRLL